MAGTLWSVLVSAGYPALYFHWGAACRQTAQPTVGVDDWCLIKSLFFPPILQAIASSGPVIV